MSLLSKWTKEIVLGLNHLHENGIVHRNLTPVSIRLDSSNTVKLVDYALFFVTGSGKYVDFPIGDPLYLAPELFLMGPKDANIFSSDKTDMWSLGMILLDLYFGSDFLDQDKRSPSLLSQLGLNVPNIDSLIARLPQNEFGTFVRSCIQTNPQSRPTAVQMLQHPFLVPSHAQTTTICTQNTWQPRGEIELPPGRDFSFHFTWNELIYFWKLSSGYHTIESLLSSSYSQNASYPVHSFPTCLTSTEKAEEKILASQMHVAIYTPCSESFELLHLETTLAKVRQLQYDTDTSSSMYKDDWKYIPDWTFHHLETVFQLHSTLSRPVLHGENKIKDFAYQYRRLRLFHDLLLKYPTSREQIGHEAVKDISPLLRGTIWSALLDIQGDPRFIYDALDKDTPSDIDRQLDLDIPRCHQYDELLSTPNGHQKLRRVLKAWVISEKGRLVYWQGLDSVAAVFVTLHSHDESLAFASMQAFTRKFCEGFYIPDNSKVMREYVLAFRCILSFHEPRLAAHLHQIALGPELYAIPWFMTLFAHIFSLDKIYVLWDHLLTHPSRFFFMFVAAMLIFSELPPLDFEQCIADAIMLSKITPPSLFHHLLSWNSFTLTPTKFDSDIPDALKRFSFLSTKRGMVGTVSIADAQEMRRFSVFIDLRDISSFQASHIPQSLWVKTPLSKFPRSVKDLVERKRFVILLPLTSHHSNQNNHETTPISPLAEEFAAQCVLEGIEHVLLLQHSEFHLVDDIVEKISNGYSCNCANATKSADGAHESSTFFVCSEL